MRVINIIEQESGVITNLTSFGVFEEQLSEDVVEKAETFFKEQLLKNVKFDDEEDEDQIVNDAIESGHYDEANNNFYTIDIIWSDI